MDTTKDVVMSAQMKNVLDNVMFELSLATQSIINETDFPDESAKAQYYVNIVTQIADYVSNMIPQLNKKGIENIIKEYGIEIPDSIKERRNKTTHTKIEK